MATQTYQFNPNITIDKGLIEAVADNIADEIAKKMYYNLLMLRFLPEVDAVEKGKAKGLKGKEIDKFFNNLMKSK